RARTATAINGQIPGPTLRSREGDTLTLAVTNRLSDPTSIHWHGIRTPSRMDGVPGLSFAGIPPGQTFVYRFPVHQSGTYWYHSHSAFQEQTGVYGPIIVEPKGDMRTRSTATMSSFCRIGVTKIRTLLLAISNSRATTTTSDRERSAHSSRT